MSPRTYHTKGLGGWLILPMIGLFITPLRLGYLLFTVHFQIFLTGTWGVLTTSGNDFYHPLWAPLLIFETLANIILITWSVALIILLFTKSHLFPRWIILFYLASLTVVGLDLGLSQLIPLVAEQDDPTAMTELLRSVVATLIWVPYFTKSERVKNTFVKPGSPEPQPTPLDAASENHVPDGTAEP